VSHVEDTDRVRAERVRAIGLFRYQLVRAAADPGLSSRERGRMVRELAAAEHVDPTGRRVRISRDTLDRWIRAWRAGGFEALVPAPRQCAIRTDPQVLEVAAALKRENPARTAAQVVRILLAQHGWAPSASTVLRHFHRLDLAGPASPGTPSVFGRFEANHPNELWTGDALHGPRLAGRKTYLFAFIDDHSRLLTGYRWGFAEDTVRLATALRPALASRGVPESVYVDNGSAFVDSWLLRACAKLGIKLVHSTPGRPQGRGKIERFFRTVEEQFVVEIAGNGLFHHDPGEAAGDLFKLNELFKAWVETVYHRHTHSETGQAPLQRWHDGWDHRPPPRMPSTDALREAFLWEERRQVRKTACVSLHGNVFQVDTALVGHRVELVFDPFDMTTIEVRYRGVPHGLALPHRITRHSHPKARPETAETETPKPTGINYLGIIAATHQNDTGGHINFHALARSDHDSAAGPQEIPEQATATAATDSITALDNELAGFAALAHDLAQTSSPREAVNNPDQIPGQLDLTDLLPDTDQQNDQQNGQAAS
jgi:putative transposase